MHNFVRSLITEWRKLGLPCGQETIVVGVSGGADSLSLLLAIEELRGRKKLDCRIVAAHFNHKLRGSVSDADEEFVRELAMSRKFELAIGHGRISTDGNLEQNARDARYAFLTRTALNLGAGLVLTAHTLNDQAETFLLNLIRGSGFDGLAAMPPIRSLGSEFPESEQAADDLNSTPFLPFESVPLQHARPLLRWAKRSDTENFCRSSDVEFRYDTMNEDMSFKRVRIRKILLPMLKEFNPRIVETLARTAEIMKQASRPINGQEPPEELAIKELTVHEPALLRQSLRSWLKLRRGHLRAIGLKHFEAIERLVLSPKSGRTVELPGSGRVCKQNGRLRFENIKVD